MTRVVVEGDVTEADGLTLTEEQECAVRAIVDWYMTEDAKRVFKLHGYAGTGKTTCLREAVRRIEELAPDVRVHFAAPTGKAAHVMQSKGLAGATTLHTSGLIWNYPKSRRTGRKYSNPLLKGQAGLDEVDLLVVDECSMLGSEIVERILRHPDPKDRFEGFGERRAIRVLAVGDPAQLWPIPDGGKAAPSPWARESEHDYRLETIHRSTEGSAILAAASAMRGPSRDFGAMWRYLGMGKPDMADLLRADQIIAYTNETRWFLISALRRAKGLPEGVPAEGDRLVLLRNGELGANGEQFEVKQAIREVMYDPEDGETEWFDYFAISLSTGQRVNVPVCMFEGPSGETAGKTLCGKAPDMIPLTFAEAITCHKAQGSEWARVLIVDEGYVAYQSEGWHCTAITRAREHAAIVRAGDLPTAWTLHEARVIREEWRQAVWDSDLSITTKVTARAIVDRIADEDTIRVNFDDGEIAERVGRAISTIQNHKTKLRKAGFLVGRGAMTMLGFPEGITPPSTLKQLHNLMLRQALYEGNQSLLDQ